MSTSIYFQYYDSPCGELMIASFEDQICICDWRYRKQRLQINERIAKGLQAEFTEQSTVIIEETIVQLERYFNKGLHHFKLPILTVGTKFQKQVWKQLRAIPYGETLSYAQLADQMNNPLGIRAIASANGANALSIIIPCHRIIGSDGNLVGYAGGLPAKKQLLRLEGALKTNQISLF